MSNFNPRISCNDHYTSVIDSCNDYSNLDHPEAHSSNNNCDDQSTCKYVDEIIDNPPLIINELSE